jgi:hypothetical protein
VVSKEGPNVFKVVLRNSNMVVFLWCTAYYFALDLTFGRKSGADTAKTSLPPFNLSQLSNEVLLVCSFVPRFCSAVLKFTLLQRCGQRTSGLCSLRRIPALLKTSPMFLTYGSSSHNHQANDTCICED